MAQIVSVEACTVQVPLSQPTSFSTREVTERHYTLVRVRDADGHRGLGFCYAGSFGGEIVSAAVRSLVAPVVIGQDSRRVRGIWDDVYAATLLHGRAGSVTRAHSAVDVAIWDLNARAVGQPLWQFLGASAAGNSVPAYASGGYYLAGKSPDDLGAEMVSYVQSGFAAVKMKVGRASASEDAERLQAVREAVGPDVLIMLDANNAWHDLPTALAAVRKLEPFDPYWIEEPFGPDDILNHARLARRTPVTVATGEIETGRWRHRELLEQGGAAILQTDAAVCGGITEYQRIAATAESFGVSMCPHWFHDLHVHLVASTSNGQYVEFFPDDLVLNFRRLVSRQLTVLPGGRLELPTEPGLGFDFVPDVIDEYAVDDWA